MNPVNNTNAAAPVQKIVTKPVDRTIPADAPKQLPASDKLELSGLSHLFNALKNNDIRTDKVAGIKAQIENGSYEDDHKLDVATDRLLNDLLK